MKKLIAAILSLTVLSLGVALADKGEVTLSGKGCCAKCCLKQADKCQNVLAVEKDGKKTTYWLVGDVSKAFHKDNLCSGVHPIKVTGTCKKVGDKLEVTVSKIALAE